MLILAKVCIAKYRMPVIGMYEIFTLKKHVGQSWVTIRFAGSIVRMDTDTSQAKMRRLSLNIRQEWVACRLAHALGRLCFNVDSGETQCVTALLRMLPDSLRNNA